MIQRLCSWLLLFFASTLIVGAICMFVEMAVRLGQATRPRTAPTERRPPITAPVWHPLRPNWVRVRECAEELVALPPRPG